MAKPVFISAATPPKCNHSWIFGLSVNRGRAVFERPCNLIATFRIRKGIRRKARSLIAAEVAHSRFKEVKRITLSKLMELAHQLEVNHWPA